uniref:Uncharacterized protein n=1 Tax=Anguilla anguilla TaxID=7936 RepID=A0A0E9XLI1_ANGAN
MKCRMINSIQFLNISLQPHLINNKYYRYSTFSSLEGMSDRVDRRIHGFIFYADHFRL